MEARQNTNAIPTEIEMIRAELTPEEFQSFQKILHFVRVDNRLTEDDFSTSYAFRFFRGHKRDVAKTIQALSKTIEWRKTAPFQQAIDFDLSRFDFTYQHVKLGFYGLDFQGRPIRIIRPSNFDPKILIDRYTDDDRYLYSLQNLERVVNIVFPMCSKKAGRYIEGMISIIDIKEVNTAKYIKNMPYMHSFQSRAKELQDHYPEMAHKVVIINSGYFFTGLWNVIKLFLNKLTQEKITIMGSNYMGELSKFVSPENLPVCIGGSCTEDINSYPNFFDKEFKGAIAEKRLKPGRFSIN